MSGVALRVDTKLVRVMASDETIRTADSLKQVEEVKANIDWSQVEDAVNDQLPDGYYCKVDDRVTA